MTASSATAQDRSHLEASEVRVPDPPDGFSRLKWLGPGFLWMVSAAGSGELLFSPRIGALYGYALTWALLAAVTFKWFINREIGRYAVCTGRPILEGFERLPGRGNWALWLILVPQFFVAVATIAGLASGAATAAILIAPGGTTLWTFILVLSATALVLWGRYGGVEKAATAIALALAVAGLAAAATVLSQPDALLGGLVPQMPEDVDYGEVLPWIGFALSGAAGMMWYSYWLTAKGYGAAGAEHDHVDPRQLDEENRGRLRGWLRQLTLDNTVAVVGTLLIMLAFLVLGVELLQPRGLVPEEQQMAETLGRLLGGVWGRFGFWIMVGGVLIGFWSTVLSDQDGFARLFANGTRLVAAGRRKGQPDEDSDQEQEKEKAPGNSKAEHREHVRHTTSRRTTTVRLLGVLILRRQRKSERVEVTEGVRAEPARGGAPIPSREEYKPEQDTADENDSESHLQDESFLQRVYLIVVLTVLPLGLYLLRGEPVTLLKIAGAIEAAHIPVLAGLTLYLNRRELPDELRPSRFTFYATAVAGLFFLVFAAFYVYRLLTGQA